MDRVRKWVLFPAVFLSGCIFLPSGERSRVEKIPPAAPPLVVPSVPDRYPYADPSELQVGVWARYREGDRVIRLSVVARDASGTWVEEAEEGDPQRVSAQLVTPDGVLKEAYYREIAKGGASAIEPQELRQWTPPASGLTVTSRESGTAVYRLEGRELEVKTVKVVREDLAGRLQEETTAWHADVPPLYDGSKEGGLVRKQTPKLVVELLAFGTGAKRLVEPPK